MKEITTHVDIAAPPEAVWQVLMDFPSYSDWNPFIRTLEGTPDVGEQLLVRLRPPGGRMITLQPRVVDFVPGRRLVWHGNLFIRGMFDGKHAFELEELDDGSTRFVHREEFTGPLVSLIWGSVGERTRRGFEGKNEALKERVEEGRRPRVHES